jgi:hypothetical protein
MMRATPIRTTGGNREMAMREITGLGRAVAVLFVVLGLQALPQAARAGTVTIHEETATTSLGLTTLTDNGMILGLGQSVASTIPNLPGFATPYTTPDGNFTIAFPFSMAAAANIPGFLAGGFPAMALFAAVMDNTGIAGTVTLDFFQNYNQTGVLMFGQQLLIGGFFEAAAVNDLLTSQFFVTGIAGGQPPLMQLSDSQGIGTLLTTGNCCFLLNRPSSVENIVTFEFAPGSTAGDTIVIPSQFEPLPEPSSLALLGVGVSFLAWRRRQPSPMPAAA